MFDWRAWDAPEVSYLGDAATKNDLYKYNELQRVKLEEKFGPDPWAEDVWEERVFSYIQSNWIKWLEEATGKESCLTIN
jgi:hypothetical protein